MAANRCLWNRKCSAFTCAPLLIILPSFCDLSLMNWLPPPPPLCFTYQPENLGARFSNVGLHECGRSGQLNNISPHAVIKDLQEFAVSQPSKMESFWLDLVHL